MTIEQVESFFDRIPEAEMKARAQARYHDVQLVTTELRSRHRAARAQMSATLESYWSEAFEKFEDVIIEATELGKAAAERSPTALSTTVSMAHHGLLARGLQTAWEILGMLRSGHGHGAYARWRTLFELSAVAEFLKQRGPEAADAFCDHYAIETYKLVRHRFPGIDKDRSRFPEATRELFEKLETRRNELSLKYGKVFLQDHGWATAWLSGKSPKLLSIIESVPGLSTVLPEYRSASYYVHAVGRGALDHHIHTESGPVLIATPTPLYISRPGRLAAVSLSLVTSVCAQACQADLDGNVWALGAMAVDAEDAFRRGHRAWVKDTNRIDLAWQE